MASDIRKSLKRFLPHLLKAREDNLNEADTLLRIIKVFEEVLGYDPMGEITREAQIKDKYVDLAIKIDDTVRLLVEAKAAATVLRDRHIDQAQHYAAEGNIPWVLLTNGVIWNLYHLSFEEGVEYVRAFSLDLASDSPDRAEELLGLLERQAIKKGELDEYWEHRAALSPESIGRAIFTEEALKFIRREIRRREGILIDEEDLANAIHEMLSTEAREQVGPVKIRRRAKSRKQSTSRELGTSAAPTGTTPGVDGPSADPVNKQRPQGS